MSTNVKPGDLAIVVSDSAHPANVGAIVAVIERHYVDYLPVDAVVWVCATKGRGLMASAVGNGRRSTPQQVQRLGIWDVQLRPVSGLPLDETTPAGASV